MSTGPQAARPGPPHLTPPAGPLWGGAGSNSSARARGQCHWPTLLPEPSCFGYDNQTRSPHWDSQPGPQHCRSLASVPRTPPEAGMCVVGCCWPDVLKTPGTGTAKTGVCKQTHEPMPSHRPEEGGDACSPGSACRRGHMGPTGAEHRVRVSEPAPPTSPPPRVFFASPAWRNGQGRVVRTLDLLGTGGKNVQGRSPLRPPLWLT